MNRLSGLRMLAVCIFTVIFAGMSSFLQAEDASAYSSQAWMPTDPTQDIYFFNLFTAGAHSGESLYIFSLGDPNPTLPGHNLLVVCDSTAIAQRTERNIHIFESGGVWKAQYVNTARWGNGAIDLGSRDTFGLFFGDASNSYLNYTPAFPEDADNRHVYHHMKVGVGNAAPVPIPGTIWLFGPGLIGFAAFRFLDRRSRICFDSPLHSSFDPNATAAPKLRHCSSPRPRNSLGSAPRMRSTAHLFC